VRANCDTASCIVACSKDETLLAAHCGARKTPALFPTPDSATCHRHEPASNPLIATCASSASLVTFAAPTPAAASRVVPGELPKYDIGATCRAGARNRAALDTCTRDEEEARERLTRDIAQLPHADVSHCSQLSGMKGFESYVELLTCLEMARDARTLPKEITQQ
jgi:hypothetical protein